MEYDVASVEQKWRGRYQGLAAYRAVDFDVTRKKKYVLVEFPYPSGAGLHVGHAFSFTATDVYARYLRMRGENVLFPMGWDSFGLPTENYAIKTGINPQLATRQNTAAFKEQMNRLGIAFDWERELDTTDPKYYKWTQWIFIKLFEKGLAEKKEMPINWCPKDKIGLANEEVIDGKCERCGTEVVQRSVSQWVVKITEYAERLLSGLEQTDFIKKVKAAQVNWIGKKEGLEIEFKINDKAGVVSCFSKYPETIFGVTWLVVSPEYPQLSTLVTKDHQEEVQKYREQTKKKSEFERTSGISEKTGVFCGSYAINPVNGKKIPIWIGDYVLSSFGTGAVMGVALHDRRDFLFAKKYGLETVQVEVPPGEPDYKVDSEEKVLEDGVMINSEKFNGMWARSEAFAAVGDWLVANGWAKKKVEYHLRDWIFSRQHYWGEPIPMIYCDEDGWVSVPEEELPVQLPVVERYQPTDTGESPLANIKEFVEARCPKCGGSARRETDTMPNWAGSDWYFLRYLDPGNDTALADMAKMKYWLPVDVYVGGDEHNTLHLLYSRFIYQFLWDLGVMPKEYPEPYIKRISHGLILGPDGAKMSKSRGNVISPDDVVAKYGADALRTYLMFIGPFDAHMAWNERALVGVARFLTRIYDFVSWRAKTASVTTEKNAAQVINRLVMSLGEDVGSFKFNTAVAKLMGALNNLGGEAVSHEDLGKIVRVLAPLAPFLAEELWSQLGFEFSVHAQAWPDFDENLTKSEVVTVAVQVNGKMRGTVEASRQLSVDRVQLEAVVTGDEKYNKWIQGKKYKAVFVPGRLINFVIE